MKIEDLEDKSFKCEHCGNILSFEDFPWDAIPRNKKYRLSVDCNFCKKECFIGDVDISGFFTPLKNVIDTKENENIEIELLNKMISAKCDELKELLIQKNISYGGSFAKNDGIFANGFTPEDRIKIRIDDKINRLRNGKEFDNEDTVKDLTGYLILLQVIRDLKYKHPKEIQLIEEEIKL